MEIDEIAARVLRRYWLLLIVAALVPILGTWVVVGLEQPRHAAVARLDAPNPNADVAGDAGVAITVSQVKAFATSYSLLSAAIRDEGLRRAPAKVAPRIDVTGLGTSSVVELRIVDHDPNVARRLTDAVAAKVVAQINQSNNENLTQQIATIDQQIGKLFKRLSTVSTRAQNPNAFDAINEKAGLQTRIENLESDRRDLRNQLVDVGVARVVQPAVAAELGSGKIARLVLAGLIGLVAGILITILIEAFRPTVPGAQRVARRLGVPLLGQTDEGQEHLTDLGRRIKLAAKREGVTKVALVAAGDGPLPADLVSRVARAVYGGSTPIVAPVPPAERSGRAAAARTGEDTAGDGDRPGDLADGLGEDLRDPLGDGIDDRLGLAGDGSRTGAAARAASRGELERLEQEFGGRGTAVGVTRPVAAPVNKHAPTPSPAPQRVRFHVCTFDDIDPGADTERFGLVAVTGPVAPLAAIRSVHDLTVASGWPLLGVVATSRQIRGK